MVLGEDGIIAQAKLAAEKTKDAEEQQAQDLDSLVGMINEAVNGKDPETLENALSSKKVFSHTTGFDARGNKIEEGSEESTTPVITIPAGFRITDGDVTQINKGVVVSDEAGNEFVWVPCTEAEYKKHDYTTDDWKEYEYAKYSDWTDDGGNLESVKKYGGFYIARYEAGVPSNASFYVKAEQSENMTFSADKNNISNLKPVSKKGVQAWNCISQTNAKTVSKAMYSGNIYVTSQLVDGIAWDTIVEWIAKDGTLSDVVKKDSTDYGNYANNKTGLHDGSDGLKIENDVLYADHTEWRTEDNDGAGWNLVKNYKYGIPTSGTVDPYEGALTDYVTSEKPDDKYHVRKLLELSTGASEDTKLKNIYDLGGNMYEWTTETGYHGTGSGTQYAVLRGGSFYDCGDSHVVSIRSGNIAVGYTFPDFGFRVVLYVK